MSRTVAQLTVESLIQNGIKSLYCVPGVQNDALFDAIYDRQNELKPVQARHEQGAAYMALGAALATGQPQAFAVVPGPGFLNACAALCTAYALNAPVLAVVGQIPSDAIGKQLGLLHEINGQLETLEKLTKFSERIISGTAVEQLSKAWMALQSGRPQPVGLEIPVDVWLHKTEYTPDQLNVERAAPAVAESDQISAAVKLISEANYPLIAVGGGAQDHSEEIRQLAKATGAAVMAFRTGHGVMDSRDPLSINMPVGHALWTQCDLVIGLGTRLTAQKQGWGVDDKLKILHIDVDAETLQRTASPTLGIQADLASVLAVLNSALGEQPDRSDWLQRITAEKNAFDSLIANELSPQLGWLQSIRDALPDEAIFVDELTQLGYVSRFAFPSYLPRTFLSTGYQGTLGWGIATALGAAHARPDVPVVSIAGDGGALFTINELATAAHHNIPLNIVVMNDNAYGNVKGMQRDLYNERYIASDLTSPDFVQLAQSFGVTAARVTTPDELNLELKRAINNTGPNLIEVTVNEFPSPWKYIHLPRVRGLS